MKVIISKREKEALEYALALTTREGSNIHFGSDIARFEQLVADIKAIIGSEEIPVTKENLRSTKRTLKVLEDTKDVLAANADYLLPAARDFEKKKDKDALNELKPEIRENNKAYIRIDGLYQKIYKVTRQAEGSRP